MSAAEFVEGQVVLVTGRAESESDGWDNEWTAGMNPIIGNMGRIIIEVDDGDLQDPEGTPVHSLRTPKMYSDDHAFRYPHSVLVAITEGSISAQAWADLGGGA